MTQQLTAVSLFAGIGGFDLALERNGVDVVAAVEIDKHATQVLKHRFPNTTLFTDVTEVSGDQLTTAGFIPERGIITGGFPCQDLSVAGKRLGFTGKRSSLFYQVARIADETQARWLVLENVLGLLSSQRGADMGAVVGTLVDLGYCVGWRVLDAQHFGVPQRRRRVFIVAERAGDPTRCSEVLFERDSVQWHSAPSREAWEEITRGSGQGIEGSSVYPINTLALGGRPDPVNDARMTMGVGAEDDPQFTITASHPHAVAITADVVGTLQARSYKGVNHENARDGHLVIEEPTLYEPHHGDGRETTGVANTLTSRMGTGGNNTPVLIAYSVREDAQANNFSATELEAVNTIQSYQPSPQSHHAQVFIVGETDTPLPIQDAALVHSGKRGDKNDGRGNGLGIGKVGDPMYTLTSSDRHAVLSTETSDDPVYSIEPGAAQRLPTERHWEEVAPTLRANAGDNQVAVATSLAVRRLTPLECERLQGFPDNWTLDIGDGKTQADSHRYKQLGNAVAVPVVNWIIEGVVRASLPRFESTNSVG